MYWYNCRMSILVTGTPGSGKTTLVKYAKISGDIRFFDADEIIGLCEWREFDTGQVLGLVTDHKESGEDAWYKKYGWYWRLDFLTDFLTKNPDSILCGSSENIVDSYKYFDKIIILKKTEEELLTNLQNPERNNPFGKTAEQRKNFLKWQDYLIKEAENYSPIIIEGNNISNTYNSVRI